MGIRHFNKDGSPIIGEIINDVIEILKNKQYIVNEITVVGGYANEIYSEYYQNFKTDMQEIVHDCLKTGADFDILVQTEHTFIRSEELDDICKLLNDGKGKHECTIEKEFTIDIWANEKVFLNESAVVLYPEINYQKYNSKNGWDI